MKKLFLFALLCGSLSNFAQTTINSNLDGFSFIRMPNLISTPPTPINGFSLFANSTNSLSWKGTNGFVRTFDGTSNTADRVYTLPNQSGTFPLLESSQTWSGVNSFTGNVGIGTTTPTSKLHVVGNRIAIESESPTIYMKNINSGYGINALEFSANNDVKIANGAIVCSAGGGKTTMYVQNNGGNVGIGTITPTSTLSVVGSQSGSLLSVSTATTLANQRFIIVTAGVPLTLPAASTCNGRFYTINARIAGVTISSYFDLTGTTQTSIADGTSIVLISDGTNWQRVE